MKHFEYGIRTYESVKFVGRFGEEANKHRSHVMDALSRLGAQGWEIYQVVPKDDVIHFLIKKEITQAEALEKKMSKDEDTYPIGLVDH